MTRGEGTANQEYFLPPELLQSMPPITYQCSVCLENYRPSEEATPPWWALERQLCPIFNTMQFPTCIAPP